MWKRSFKIKHMSFLPTPAIMKYLLQRLVFPLYFSSNVILQFLSIVNSSATELGAVWQRFSVFFLLFFKKESVTSVVQNSRSSNHRNSHWSCSVKKLFLELAKNSQQNRFHKLCVLVNLQCFLSLWPATLLKSRPLFL